MKKLPILVSHLVLAFSAASALNLQPQETTVEKDGPPVRRYFFLNGNKKVLFRIDGRMSVSGSANQAVFRFSDIRNGTMRLTKSGMNPQTNFDEKNLELYRVAARGFVPGQATDVQIIEEKSDAIPINGWVNHQFVMSYKVFGVSYHQSITFFNYNATEQLVFDVMSEEHDYEKTYARSYSVLNSLSDYVPARAAGPS
jgi:hypothetical protein